MTPDAIRLDKWLWHTRLAKTRSLAARLCAARLVELGGAVADKPAQTIRIGDRLVLRHGGRRRELEVLGLGARRGPPAEARLLYRETAAQRIEQGEPGWVPLIEEPEGAEE